MKRLSFLMILFCLAMSSNSVGAEDDAPKIITIGEYRYYNAEYIEGPILYEMCHHELAKDYRLDICIGYVKIAREHLVTKERSWVEGWAICDANLGSTCPPAFEAWTNRTNLFSGYNPSPRIVTRKDAIEEYRSVMLKVNKWDDKQYDEFVEQWKNKLQSMKDDCDAISKAKKKSNNDKVEKPEND